MAACELASQTPQVVVVTATPEPADSGPPLPTVPTWTPEPTWTPQPTPTPTATPFPTPTPNLQQYAEQNAGSVCIGVIRERLRNAKANNYTHEVREVIADDSGQAFVKIFGGGGAPHPYYNYEYMQYQPGPVSGTGACKNINQQAYPTPAPDPRGGEHRIRQVAEIAEEICWNLSVAGEEIRPATETYALVKFPRFRYSGDNITQRRSHIGDSYALYDAITNTCAESEYARQAWSAWPEILPTPTPEAPPTPIPTATAAAPAEATPTIPPTAAP